MIPPSGGHGSLPDALGPLGPLMARGYGVLDGGLATHLESLGHDLRTDLWSARILIDSPAAISRVHREYLEAGADCITTATYQATIPGFMRSGLSASEATALLQLGVRLAVEARDAYWAGVRSRTTRLRPLVAVSVGPYGAFLADGSEYTGRYGIDDDELYRFHRRRWQVWLETEADVMACETIPSMAETRALLGVLDETSGPPTWFSFTCRDARHLSDGTPLSEVMALLTPHPRVAAVGVNCVPPGLVMPAIETLREHTDKPLVVYPNSGEHFDATTKEWEPRDGVDDLGAHAIRWWEAGATLIGGCCRTGPRDIAEIAAALATHRAG